MRLLVVILCLIMLLISRAACDDIYDFTNATLVQSFDINKNVLSGDVSLRMLRGSLNNIAFDNGGCDITYCTNLVAGLNNGDLTILFNDSSKARLVDKIANLKYDFNDLHFVLECSVQRCIEMMGKIPSEVLWAMMGLQRTSDGLSKSLYSLQDYVREWEKWGNECYNNLTACDKLSNSLSESDNQCALKLSACDGTKENCLQRLADYVGFRVDGSPPTKTATSDGPNGPCKGKGLDVEGDIEKDWIRWVTAYSDNGNDNCGDIISQICYKLSKKYFRDGFVPPSCDIICNQLHLKMVGCCDAGSTFRCGNGGTDVNTFMQIYDRACMSAQCSIG